MEKIIMNVPIGFQAPKPDHLGYISPRGSGEIPHIHDFVNILQYQCETYGTFDFFFDAIDQQHFIDEHRLLDVRGDAFERKRRENINKKIVEGNQEIRRAAVLGILERIIRGDDAAIGRYFRERLISYAEDCYRQGDHPTWGEHYEY